MTPPLWRRARMAGAIALVVSGCGTADRLSAPEAVVTPRVQLDAAPVGRVVISQVYGAGGNNGALFNADYVELYNAGTATVSLTGWSVQYASATGSGNFGGTASQIAALGGTIEPGQYYLVRLAGGSTGSALPAADASGSIAMAAGAGKVALVDQTASLGCNGGSTPCSEAQRAHIIDLVGYGTGSNGANFYEGTGAAPTLSTAFAAFRRDGGRQDTNDNAADFEARTPAPRNTASPRLPRCTAGPVASIVISPATPTVAAGATVSLVARAYDAASCEALGEPITWSSLDEGFATVSATGVVKGVAAGTARIRAEAANGVAAQVTVTVSGATQTPTASIRVTGRTAPLPSNETATLTATALDAAGNPIPGRAVTWRDSTPAIARIEPSVGDPATGTVRPVAGATGRAWFVATASDGFVRAYFLDITGPAEALRLSTFREGALPVGFSDILNVEDAATNTDIFTGLTWTSSAPSVVAVEEDGTITARAVGSATITATQTATGKTGTFTVSTVVAAAADPAIYGDHLEFGTPTDGTPGDDFLITGRATYVSSYNAARGQPNWVAYNLDGAHHGGTARCDCFTHDPQLPTSFTRISSAEYLGSGYSRGHLVMSADRDVALWDNATTFYFSNIIPQTSANNGGAWLQLEQHLGNQADAGREVYIVAGGAKYQGTLKGLGHVAIPTRTWKVAVLMPRNQGLAQATSPQALELIAVDMPNAETMPSGDWRDYRVTVDSLERLTGYDFLSRLPDHIEAIVESGDRRPTARITGPTTGAEGQALVFDGAASSDPDVGGPLGDALSYLWTVDGAPAGIQPTLTRTFPDDGAHVVRLIVSDRFGWGDTTETTVTVANVAPAVQPFAGATLLRGETYQAAGSFADPGDDEWTATVDYGAGPAPLALSGRTFQLSRTYPAAGTFTVTVAVRDDDGGTGTRSATVVVKSAADGIAELAASIAGLATAGRIEDGDAKWLANKLDVAAKQLEKGNDGPAVNELEQVIARLEAMARDGRIAGADGASLTAYAGRIIRSIGG